MSRTTAGRSLGIFTKREVTDHGFPTGAMCRPLTKNEAIGNSHPISGIPNRDSKPRNHFVLRMHSLYRQADLSFSLSSALDGLGPLSTCCLADDW